MMEIKTCLTSEWTEWDWETYVIGFNEVFQKEYTASYFKKKYTSVTGGDSYHALLLDGKAGVVGACSIIPCQYTRGGDLFTLGLAVDVFIRESYRVDPLMLRRMYKKLRVILAKNNVVSVMAVPNATAYPYWKNVVKWKDVGTLTYWALPVRAGNVIKKIRFLNIFSLIYAYLISGLANVLSFLCESKASDYKYMINGKDPFFRHRYDGDYHVYKGNDGFYSYRIVNEDGVKTAYILEATTKGQRSFRAFSKAVRDIMGKKVDLILYIGKMGFHQLLFLQVPKKIEPKLLPLTCDLISNEEKYKDMYDFLNWDFGLKNYDVR